MTIDQLKRLFLSHFHRRRRGTAMTEFVAMVPIFITIFVAIMEIGAIARAIPQSSAKAVVKTFQGEPGSDSVHGIQERGRDGLIATVENFKDYDTPGLASADSMQQLTTHPPKHDPIFQKAIAALETNAYAAGLSSMGSIGASLGGMARGGMWAESIGRLAPIGLAGNTAYIYGAEEMATADPGQVFGDSSEGRHGSRLSKALLYDGYRPKAAVNLGGEGCEGAGVLQKVLTAANQIFSATGIRAPLAAGVTYGTVTREAQTKRKLPSGLSFKMQDYYTVTVPPRGFPTNAGMATAITRIGLENCSAYPAYPGIQGVGTEGLFSNQAINVPDPEKVGFTRPFNYMSE